MGKWKYNSSALDGSSLATKQDYADTARRKKLIEKENTLRQLIYLKLVGKPNNPYLEENTESEKQLRKNIKRYYENNIDVDQLERSALHKALVLRHVGCSGASKNCTHPPNKAKWITHNGKQIRVQ
jgi:hypothetical protein